MRDGQAIGCIMLSATEPGGYTDSQIALLHTFAEQAVIAIASATNFKALRERTADLQESLEYQTATSDVLKVISRSTFDLQPVLDTVVEKATRLCEADAGILCLRHEDALRVDAVFADVPEIRASWLGKWNPVDRSSLGGRAASEERIVHVRDVATDPEYANRHTGAVRVSDVRTGLGVPLLREGVVVGTISLARHRVEAFSERQIELVSTFADQAVIAIENTRLITETREALAQQTATAEVLQVINASPGDLTPVFEAILEKAMMLCEAAFGSFYVADGSNDVMRAHRNVPPDYAEFRRRHPLSGRPGSRSERMRALFRETRRPVHTLDLTKDEFYESGDASDRALADIGGARTSVMVPLFKGDEFIALISLYRQEVRAFTDKQIALLENFAAQAVIAMENARLLGELRERTAELAERNTAFAERIDHQAATIDVLKAMSASPGDPQPVFDLIVRQAHELCDSPGAMLGEYDGELLHLRSILDTNADPAVLEIYKRTYPMLPRQGPQTSLYLENREVHVRDIDADPDIPAAARATGIRSLAGVPFRRDGKVIGAILLTRSEPGGYSDTQIELLRTFAEQAVIAITSAETYRALQTRTADLQESLEYQTATSDVLKVISRSTFDLQPVLDTVGETALRLAEADLAMIGIREGNSVRMLTNISASSEYDAFYRGMLVPVSRATVSGRTILEGQVTHIEDITSDPDYVETAATRAEQLRTGLGVPLLRDGVVVGVITLARKRVEPFTGRQVDLVSTFADQAVIAIENTRLLTEQREALEQQTATAEVLQVINASPGDLTPVFEVILEKAHALCGAEIGALATYDGEFMRAVAVRGLSAEHAALVTEPYRPSPGGGIQRLIDGARFSQIPDMWTANLSGFAGMFSERTGLRTYLGIPLRKDGAFVGQISAYRREVRPFAEKEIALLENFAAQAVIAMENARLLTETREALEQQTATAEVLGVINANPGELAPVFDAMLEKAMRLCGAAFGMLRGYDGERVHELAARGLPPAYAAFIAGRTVTPLGTTAMGQALKSCLPTQEVDIREEAGYKNGSVGMRAIVDLAGGRTVLHVPLVKDQVSIGFFTFFRQEVLAFTDKQIALLENFAAQAVIAMENARLLGELRVRTSELAQRNTEYSEQNAHQAATIDVLKVMAASPGDPRPVFDLIAERSRDNCGGYGVSVYEFDGSLIHLRAYTGVSDDPAVREAFEARFPMTATRETSAGRAMLDRHVIHIKDSEAEPGLRTGLSGGTVKSVVTVPMMRGDAVIGALSMGSRERGGFSDSQIELLKTFAEQAVIAIGGAETFRALQTRTDELARRQTELRVTFENMGDGVAMFDETPRLVAWNRKFQDILDLPDGVLAERLTFPDYIRYLTRRGEFGADADPDAELRRVTERTAEHYVLERTRPDGRIIEIRSNPVASGGFVLIYADITERKRNEAAIAAARDAAEQASRTIEAAYRDLKTAQANLIQAEKMASLGQLTAGIAHEIKNPLNFVNNFAALSVDLLAELKEAAAPGFAVLTDDQRAEIDDVSGMLTSNLQKITEHGKRADGIVKAMLEHSRGASGERRTVDINMLADEALNLAYHGARAQDQSFNITLDRDFGDAIAPIEVNPQDMTRVLLNLFSNGFYAANKRARGDAGPDFNPTLKVSTREAGDAVEIRVRDNGTGIPADIRDKLFQPFFTTKPTGEGTGLGLSITYDIVTKAHGGTISVDSEVGDHTEFTIHLPRKMFASDGGQA